jgi:MFS family permease
MDDTIPATTVAERPPAGPAASPARPVGLARLLTFLFPAVTATAVLFQGIQQILLPAQIEQIAPASKVTALAVLTTLAAVASLIGLPAGGALSDRTRSRFGRRSPWLVLAAIPSAALAVGMGLSSVLVVLGLLFVTLWFTVNFYQGALTAILPDRVPAARRGLASSVIGLSTPIGVLIGVNVASRASQFWGYAIIAVVLLAATAVLVLGARESSSAGIAATAPKERRSLAGAAREFFRAFAHHDFRLAFLSRFGFFMAYGAAGGYLYFAVQDYIGTDHIPGGNVAVAVSTLSTVSLLSWIVVATACGWLADRLDRRKLFVSISAAGLGLSQLIPIISPTWTGMLVYSVVSGASLGTYVAVDLAVMSLVLPNEHSQGRDFAILTVATGLPQLLAPAIGGVLIAGLGSYDALFGFSAVCAVGAGVLALRIRSIR